MELVRSGPEPAKYNAGRIDNDWSSRHVRLRFEMVIASILFYLITAYGPNVLNLPLIDLPDSFDRGSLNLIMLSFVVFSIFSFLTRSQYEKALWPKQELLTNKEIDKVNCEYQFIASKVADLKIEDQGQIEFLHKLLSLKDSLRSFSYSVSLFSITISDLHSENGVNSPVHPKFWSKIVTLLSHVNRHSSFLSERAHELSFKDGDFTSHPYTLEAIPRDYLQNYEGLMQSIKKTSPEISERIKALKSHALVRKFQTSVLSVWLPIILSTTLLFLGICNLL